jgi:CheY-like chemotaxis protein
MSGFPYLRARTDCNDRSVSSGVLVVDDDAPFRALATRLLEGAGVSVAGEAGTVRDALDAARALEPAAVLVDVGLPDGDGITLAGVLMTLPWRPRIVLTSSDAAAGPGEAMCCSGAAFVAKDELVDCAIRVLFGMQ